MKIEKIYNQDAEANILSSILVRNDSICEVIDVLNPEDFYNARHKIIYKKLKEMYENSLPMDIVTLSEKLGEKLKEVGGVSYLGELINSSLNAVNIKNYGYIVKKKSNYRQLKGILSSSLDKLDKEEATAEDMIENVQDSLLGMTSSEKEDSGHMTGVMERFMDTLQTRYEKGGEIKGIKNGYKILDKTLGGFMRQDLVVLAARPSMGKSTMAINLLLNTVFQGQAKTAFFNLEMSKIQVSDRVVAVHTDIPMNNVKSASLTDEQWYKISKAASTIKLYDKKLTLKSIKAECKKLKIKEGLDIAFIDYLQLIDSGRKSENRNQDISKITRTLKLMAKELDITLILLSQLSRAPEQRNDHRPMIADLRESGSIEQDADIVMFLYRDEYYNKDSESKGIMECIVAKNRNGEVRTVRLRWQPEVQRVR